MPNRRSSATAPCAARGSQVDACAAAARGLRAATTRCRDMDTQRLILLFIFGFSVLMLWEAWEREHRPKPPSTASQPVQPAVPAPSKSASPTAAEPATSQAVVPAAAAEARGETIRLTSDLVVAEFDTLGGTLKRLELLR